MAARIADSIEKETVVKAPIEKVYDAVTKPEQFVKWWPDCKIAKGSLRPGEVSIIDFGSCGGKCAVFVVEARPHSYFAYRWVLGPENPQVGEDDPRKHSNTLVEYHFEPAGKDTRVRVVESGFASLPAEQLARCADHINEGWPIIIGMLAAYFEKK
jgi:uncharacterized protein YndB with AHSA1/START domain